ncbi:TPA: hypothetical protein U5D84_000423 [Yersinia enterocolitica]|nr:hypothetical protein [Yersinia enterocolitica]
MIKRIIMVFAFVSVLISFATLAVSSNVKMPNGWDYVTNINHGKLDYENATKYGSSGSFISLLGTKKTNTAQIGSPLGIQCSGFCQIILSIDNDKPKEIKAYFDSGVLSFDLPNELLNSLINSSEFRVSLTVKNNESKTFVFDMTGVPFKGNVPLK